MPQTFSIVTHLHEMSDSFFMLDEKDRDAILTRACEIIEGKLADSDYLRRYTWNGQQAFYNDAAVGTSIAKGNHLVDQFYCSYDMTHTNLYLSNPKTVRGAHGEINLFDQLLWPGFGRYRVPTLLRSPTKEEILRGSRRFHRQFYKAGSPLVIPEGRLMSFYCRYVGKHFYNVVERNGMDPSLHSKFKDYIIKAIEEGLKEAIEENVGGDMAEMMSS